MATVEIAPSAARDLDRLLTTRELPADARSRLIERLRQLERHPRSGPPLPPGSPWEGARVLSGPWWFVTVYDYDAAADHVGIVAILDGRSRNHGRGG